MVTTTAAVATTLSWLLDAPFLSLTVLSYIIGGLPSSVWVGHLAGGVDVRRHGSRNPGAANVWRTVGRRYGLLVGAFDAAKGAAMVWVAWWAGLGDAQAVWVGTAAVLGHNFSPWLAFRGGKGGATTVGMLACFIFPELLVVLVIWILLSALFPRHRFVMSIASVSLSPLLSWGTGRLGWVPYFADLSVRSFSIVLASAFLAVLLWIRVLPGLLGKTQ